MILSVHAIVGVALIGLVGVLILAGILGAIFTLFDKWGD